ncbi:MAG TPA: HK97 family phage prohead protease [Aestuariivirga sp.]|nr:HK97 family phage prohead protease [Aestuariivirga sp.]
MSRKNFTYRGYAHLWATGYDADAKFPRPAFLARGALRFDDCKLCCHHDQRIVFGSVSDRFLDIWEDETGTAVGFSLPVSNRFSPVIHEGIINSEINGLSFTLDNVKLHTTLRDGVEVDIIDEATAIELSIVADPLCHSARCWHRETEQWLQPEGIRNLADAWSAGIQKIPSRAVSSFPALVASAGRFTGVAPRQPFQKQRPPRALLDKIGAILAASGRG